MDFYSRLTTNKKEIIVVFLLSLLFVLITVPGISWGTPSIWNPDELIERVDWALHGQWKFNEINFDYPSLPQYVMYGIGIVVYRLGYPLEVLIQVARLFSVLLGASVVALTYVIARLMKGNIPSGVIAAILVISSSEMAQHARYAHNDIYLTFFVCLTVYLLIRFKVSTCRLWLYLSFFCVGLATSSKYNGAGLLLVPLVLYAITFKQKPIHDFLHFFETLFIGFMMSFLGYVIGTPKALMSMSFYVNGLIPALANHANYGRTPFSMMGFLGQWNILPRALGTPVYWLFIFTFAWFCIRLFLSHFRGISINSDIQLDLVLVVLLSVVTLDLPIMVSYNYQPRFFLSIIPLMSIIAALFINELTELAYIRESKMAARLIWIICMVIIGWSLLRVAGVALLFQNDARIAASEFVNTLPKKRNVEFTLYPPTISKEHFRKVKRYPVIFKKFLYEDLPVSSKHNHGEFGIEKRRPDYLIIDSITYDRFKDDYFCSTLVEECKFFNKLLAGQTNYQLMKTFKYTLPPFLPDLNLPFLNPEIRIYERMSE